MTSGLPRPVAALLLASVVAIAGCRAEPQPGRPADVPVDPPAARDSGSVTPTGDAAADRSALQRLEAHARAAARAEGCDSAGSCATAPLGVKACGGPRDYVVYCRLTTDEAELTARLAELERFERAYNERHGLVSTCEMRLAPPVVASGGSCRASAP